MNSHKQVEETLSLIEDPKLIQITDKLTRQIQNNPSFDLDEFIRDHVEYAEDLRKLFPAIKAMVQIGAAESIEPTSIAEAPFALGDFLLGREIGRGGMGIVYEVKQLSLGRNVALKVLPFASLLDDRRLERFKNEARSAASLKHPNIVSVYSVGFERGIHYYSMELVSGCSLAEIIASLAGSERETCRVTSKRMEISNTSSNTHQSMAAETSATAMLSTVIEDLRSPKPNQRYRGVAKIVRDVARALHYAHETGIVHRDIKPANILLDAHGRPAVTDFGLAQVQGETNLTQTGELLGTLRYMSPEQVEGKQVLDERTDVYSLGLVLFELLTLKPAFDSTTRKQLISDIADKVLPPTRKFDRHIPKDLERIVQKATLKAPSRRYQSAAEMADDLDRFVQNKPVLARNVSRFELAWRFAAKHPYSSIVTVTLAVVICSLAIVGPIVAFQYAQLAKSERVATEQAEKDRAQLLDTLEQSFTRSVKFVEEQPGTQAYHRDMLQLAVAHFERLLSQRNASPETRFYAARAYRGLGLIEHRAFDRKKAKILFAKSRKILDELVSGEPSNSDYVFALAETVWCQGTAERDKGTAIKLHSKARQLMKRAVALGFDSETKEYNAKKASCVLAWTNGFALKDDGRLDDAKQEMQASLQGALALTEQKMPVDATIKTPDQLMACMAMREIAYLFLITNDFDRCESKCVATEAAMKAVSFDVPPALYFRTSFSLVKAELLVAKRLLERGRDELLDALDDLREFERMFPNANSRVSREVDTYSLLGDLEFSDGNFSQAVGYYNDGLKLFENPDDAGYNFAWLKYRLACAQWAIENRMEARQNFEGAHRQFERILEKRDERHHTAQYAAVAYLACPDEQLRDIPRALELATDSLSDQDGRTYQLLGAAQLASNRPREAIKSFQESMRLRNGGDAVDYFFLAHAYHVLGKHDDANDELARAKSKMRDPVGFYVIWNWQDLERLREQTESLLNVGDG